MLLKKRVAESMKIAVMQPYFFPYIGYFQLAAAVDEFVFFDDVNFIKKGFINRNSLLLDGVAFAFSVSVAKISQNKAINEHDYISDFSAFLKQIQSFYNKAPNFGKVYELIRDVCLDDDLNVAKKNALGVARVFDYLNISFNYSFSSRDLNDHQLKGQEKILNICERKRATEYFNAIGGIDLYSRDVFEKQGIKLHFVKPNIKSYEQLGNEFVKGLSIIDVLMFCDKSVIQKNIQEVNFE